MEGARGAVLDLKRSCRSGASRTGSRGSGVARRNFCSFSSHSEPCNGGVRAPSPSPSRLLSLNASPGNTDEVRLGPS